MLLPQSTLRHRLPASGGENDRPREDIIGKLPAFMVVPIFQGTMETRVLILNADPVFQDRALAVFDRLGLETEIVRTLAEAIVALLAENFDAFVIEGEPPAAIEQATNAR
jgi:hypothetical protein